MFSDDHWETMAIADHNCLLHGPVGYCARWDPWANMTRGEVAQTLSNLRMLVFTGWKQLRGAKVSGLVKAAEAHGRTRAARGSGALGDDGTGLNSPSRRWPDRGLCSTYPASCPAADARFSRIHSAPRSVPRSSSPGWVSASARATTSSSSAPLGAAGDGGCGMGCSRRGAACRAVCVAWVNASASGRRRPVGRSGGPAAAGKARSPGARPAAPSVTPRRRAPRNPPHPG